jgi:hypothetical protein
MNQRTIVQQFLCVWFTVVMGNSDLWPWYHPHPQGGRTVPVVVSAYHIGDAVDTDVSMDGKLWDALRSQMPRFGVKTKVHFDMGSPDNDSDTTNSHENDEVKYHRSFALLFEDGLRSIETWPYQNWKKQYLDRIVIKFIYSKSGTGMIHSVSSSAVYKSTSSSPTHKFRVEYEWQEEEAVRLTVGSTLMLLAVFLASIVFLFQTCGLIGGEEENGDGGTYNDMHPNVMDYGRGSSYNDHKRW